MKKLLSTTVRPLCILAPSLSVWQSHSCRVNWLKLNYAATSNVVGQQRPLDMTFSHPPRCPAPSSSCPPIISPLLHLLLLMSLPTEWVSRYDTRTSLATSAPPPQNTCAPRWDHPLPTLNPPSPPSSHFLLLYSVSPPQRLRQLYPFAH